MSAKNFFEFRDDPPGMRMAKMAIAQAFLDLLNVFLEEEEKSATGELIDKAVTRALAGVMAGQMMDGVVIPNIEVDRPAFPETPVSGVFAPGQTLRPPITDAERAAIDALCDEISKGKDGTV